MIKKRGRMLEVLKGGHERKRERSGRNEGVGYLKGENFENFAVGLGQVVG